MASNDLANWYKSIPPVSRVWFTAAVVVPLSVRFGLFNPMSLILSYDSILFHFELWRLVTCLVLSGLSFNYLMNLFFLYSYSTRLETGQFAGRTADYTYMLLSLSIFLILIGLFLGVMVLFEPLILAALYVWCQLNREAIVQFWFGMQFKAIYLPWVLAVFNYVMGGSVAPVLMGIASGHLYYFLKFQYPQEYGGPQLLNTPSFFAQWFGPQNAGSIGGFGQAPGETGRARVMEDVRRRNEPEDGHRWGQGNPLGGR